MAIINLMGNSCVNNAKHKTRETSGDDVPEGTDDLRQVSLPFLDFELVVSNIELKQPPPGSVGLRLDIDGILQWNYEKHKSSDILSWKQEKHAIIKATEYELRQMFLNIRVLDAQGVEVGVLPLNMFLIITGPWRHDFLVRYHQGSSGRLSADIKCAQTIQLCMKASKVQLNFLNEHPGEMFHFTLKTQDSMGNTEETLESYDVETFLYNKKRTYEVDSQGESTTYKTRKTMILENQKGLMWSNSISRRVYQKDLPEFSLQVKVDSISNYSFHFILWKKSKDDDDTFESYGESNIPLAKLFWTDVKGSNLNPEIGADREIQIQQAIEFMGKKCGQMSIRCKVTTPKFFQQVLILTRTELGITQVRTQTNSSDKSFQSDRLRSMRSLKQNMLSQMVKSGNVKNELTQKGMRQYRELKNSIYQDILKFQRLFLQGNGAAPSFEYSSIEDMMKAQTEMIDIMEKIFPLTHVREVCVSQAAWRCLKTMLLRGEFLLQKIGFTDEDIQAINTTPRKKLKKQLQDKISLCELYQSLLLRLLNASLAKFGRKLLTEELKFVFCICTISYFKIPQFRDELLQVVVNINDEPREYCFENCHKKQEFQRLVDWERSFSKPLEVYSTNKDLVQEMKKQYHWKTIVAKKSVYFFMLIEDWATNFNTVLGSADAIKHWGAIPGYDTMIGSFIRQMRLKAITDYPDVLKDANMSLLVNQCLFPAFMKILLEKANTYDASCTLKCLELIGAYFAHFQYIKKILPSCFDSKLFYMTIKGVLVSQNCFTIAKMLQIIYLYFSVFSKPFKKQISMLLLGRPFFSLTLNWGKVVRQMFRYLILYRVLMWAKDKEVTDVLERWEKLKQIIEETERSLLKGKEQGVSLIYHKNYYEKMKSKLSIRKKTPPEELHLSRKSKSDAYGVLKTQESIPQSANSPNEEDSQILCKSIYFTPVRKAKFSQEIELKSSESMSMSLIRRGSDMSEKKSGSRQRRVSFHRDFEIAGITPAEQAYLQTHRKQMLKIQEEFRVWSKMTKNLDDVPRVDIKIPLDEGDIRPDDIQV